MSSSISSSVALDDLNIVGHQPLVSPAELKSALNPSSNARQSVAKGRAAVNEILAGRDRRLIVVVGPCSIHDVEAARAYGEKLAALAHELEDTLLLVMRAYFEKPRTTVGWKGLINDPLLDGSFRLDQGLSTARELLIDLSALGLPLATEALDPIVPQYLQDLITWTAIGARTTESQTHREMASGLSSVVGFKNGTDGGIDVAVNALKSAATAHRFLGIDADGRAAVVQTRGNKNSHIVLRGGSNGPNFSTLDIDNCANELRSAGLPPRIMVDCSHANSAKEPARQVQVAQAVAEQALSKTSPIIGLMIESNLHAGNQTLGSPQQLKYGVSITDACLGWNSTKELLRDIGTQLQRRRAA